MKITIIGTGYVGLTSGAGFAELGHDVTCVDIDVEKINGLDCGRIPFYEPGLEELVRRNYKEGRLRFSCSVEKNVKSRDIVFLAVGTPSKPDGSADLGVLFEAATEVFKHAEPEYPIKQGLTVVVKSTVPVGTVERLQKIADEVKQCSHIGVASNPEFLKEGDAVNDFLKPERVIIGCNDSGSKHALERLYAPMMLRENRMICMDVKSAELTKYACNAMLATRVSFMNEMANLCEKLGANVDLVRQGIGSDSRIGNKFLYPGVGWGGSCWRKDLQALQQMGFENQVPTNIVKAALEANEIQKTRMFGRLLKHFEEAAEKTIAVWGLAFKPRTDDIRDAPAVDLLAGLLREGFTVRAYDRAALKNIRQKFPAEQFPKLTLVDDEYAALDGADALVLMTEWAEFRQPDWAEVKRRMKGNAVFDGRNIWKPEEVRKMEFRYEGIGRPTN